MRAALLVVLHLVHVFHARRVQTAFAPSAPAAHSIVHNPTHKVTRPAPIMQDVPDMSDVGLDMLNEAMDAAVEGDAAATDVAKEAVAEKFNVRDLAGITNPMGFFDPIGFCSGASEGKIRFYREVELKHGRVAMLASVGFLVAEPFHPLFGGDIDLPAYITFQETPLQTFWFLVTFAIGFIEFKTSIFTFNSPFEGFDQAWTIKSDHEPGNLGFDPLGLRPTNERDWKNIQNKELNNGRLAMLAAAGMIAQELKTGEKLFP